MTPALLGGFPDLCHNQLNVQNWLWKNVLNQLRNIIEMLLVLDGWRFDYVKTDLNLG